MLGLEKGRNYLENIIFVKKNMSISYESAMTELQELIADLQEEAVSMDDLAAKAKRAAELIQYCREKLRHTDQSLKGLFDQQ